MGSCAGSAASGKLSVWNMRAFKKAHTFAVNGDPLLDSLAFSPDGRLLLAAGADGQLRLFTTADKSEVECFLFQGKKNHLIFRCCTATSRFTGVIQKASNLANPMQEIKCCGHAMHCAAGDSY